MMVYRQCRVMGDNGYHANGLLPVAGGVMNQSASLMDAFAILDDAVNDLIYQRRKKDATNG